MTHKNTHHSGKVMSIIAWVIGIALLTNYFADRQQQQINPNSQPASSTSLQNATVTLEQNRLGHYLVNGLVNDIPATFMLDTGASDVVIPAELASSYRLKEKGYNQSRTANGIITVGQTVIQELSIGTINLYNVRASINPGMDKSQPILLGMSALRKLELKQKNDTLTIIQTY